MIDAEYLARLRVAAMTGRLSADLGAWALRVCELRVAAAERRTLRNTLLRHAAALHGGTRYAAAEGIHRALLEFRRHPALGTLQDYEAASFMRFVQRAWQVDPEKPSTSRQLRAILRQEVHPLRLP